MKTKRFIIIISCIFVLLIISIGIYLYMNRKPKDVNIGNEDMSTKDVNIGNNENITTKDINIENNEDMPTKAVITDYMKKIGNVNIEFKKEDIIENDRIEFTLTGTSEREFSWNTGSGDFYTIYCLKNGEWKELRKKKGYNTTEAIIMAGSTNKILEIGVNWTRAYGKLKKGKYRYVENVSISEYEGYIGPIRKVVDGVSADFYVEFELY